MLQHLDNVHQCEYYIVMNINEFVFLTGIIKCKQYGLGIKHLAETKFTVEIHCRKTGYMLFVQSKVKLMFVLHLGNKQSRIRYLISWHILHAEHISSQTLYTMANTVTGSTACKVHNKQVLLKITCSRLLLPAVSFITYLNTLSVHDYKYTHACHKQKVT